MSASNMDRGGRTGIGEGAAASGSERAPQLRASSAAYAAWKPAMDVFLQRHGASGVHTEPLSEREWNEDYGDVTKWAKQALAAARALARNGDGALKEEAALSPETKAARALVAANVERSMKAFGSIYSALPEELRLQVAHLPQGWAYGLWQWLERKFQSTEADNVGVLLKRWVNLRQTEDESFDAYRARVNEVNTLLKHAKQEPTPEMYCLFMLDRLQPRYAPVVLALHNGSLLKDKANIDWDAVTTLVNSHERAERHMAGEADAAAAKAMAARTVASSELDGEQQQQLQHGVAAATTVGNSTRTQRQGQQDRSGNRGFGAGGQAVPLSKVMCYICGELGHIKFNCPSKDNNGHHDGSGGSGRGNNANRGNRTGRGGKQLVSAVVLSGPSTAAKGAVGNSDVHRVEMSYATVVKVGIAATRISKKGVSFGTQVSHGDSGNKASGDVPKASAPLAVPLTATRSNASSVLASQVKERPENKISLPVAPVTVPQSESSAREGPLARKEKVSEPPPPRWAGVDSMASISINGNKEMFKSLQPCEPFQVEVANNRFVEVSQVGTVELEVPLTNQQTMTVTLQRVYYHPSFKINLISVLQLNKNGWTFVSGPKETYLMTPDKLKIRLDRERNVTTLRCHSNGMQGEVYSLTAVEPNWDSADDMLRLHYRLGHMGFDRMVRIIKGGSTVGLGKLSVRPEVLAAARKRVLECRACIQGKGTRTALGHRGIDKGNAAGEVLHMDTYYVRTTRADGTATVEYGLTVTDSFTKLRWFTRLLSKDQGAQAVVNIILMAREQLGLVKRIHSDGGSEFINQTVKLACQRLGIEMHWGPAGAHELNSLAERGVRSHKDGGRTLLQHALLPTRFWGRSVAHSVYVWNRTHVADATGVTPFETIRKCKPSLKHVGVFGCDCYVHVAKSERDAFDAKMQPGIYLGHGLEPGTDRDSAIVYDLRSGKEVRSRDVRFLNDSFKHAAALVAGGEKLEDVLLEDEPSDNAREFNVERIIGKRVHDGRTEYQVMWTGYDEDEATWEPVDHVQGGAQEAIDEFEAQLLAGNAPQVAGTPPREEEEEEEEDPQSPRPPRDNEERKEPEDRAEQDANAASDEPAASAAPVRPHPRRSPRGNSSSLALDALDGHQRVHMAMSAICSSMPGGDEHLGPADSEMVMAVASGLSLLEDLTPANWKEAMASPQAAEWQAACDKEMAGCEAMHVWDLVERSSVPKHQVVVPVKWVFKVKVDETGAIQTYKARLTPKGFLQREGVNYFETFAATGKYKSMRLGLALTALFDHELDQLDVPQAFLNADMEEEVYMELPEGYRKGREHLVCLLLKALYGLKQAPRNWYILVSTFIVEALGFKATVSDPCLFVKRSRTGRIVLLFLFVDDFQASYHIADRAEWCELKAMLVKRFNTKDLGASTWILGMRITRDRKRRTITLDQELYITKALERYGLSESKCAPTPGVVGSAGLLGPEPEEVAGTAAADPPADRQLYQEIVGTLMYSAVSCRPDIAYQVQLLARSMQAPQQRHMTAAKRVLRYLAGTKEIGLVFGSRSGDRAADSRGRDNGLNLDVCCFTDADWANCPADRKSVYGWVAKVNGDPISWASKKQRTVALSTCEAELYAEAEGIKEVLWLRGLLKELGLHVSTGSRVYGDNQSTIAVSQNGVRSERTKHVDVRYHFVTETVRSGQVKLQWVPTRDQQADIFTKALPEPVFEHFRKLLMTR